MFVFFLVFALLFTTSEARAQYATLAANTARDLGPYACIPLAGEVGAVCQQINDYSGMAIDDATQKVYMWGGGHAATMRDDADVFFLSDGQWGHGNTSTACADMTIANWNTTVPDAWATTGHPPSRHTYDMLVLVPGLAGAPSELIKLSGTKNSASNGHCEPATWNVIANQSTKRIWHMNTQTYAWSPSSTAVTIFDHESAEYDPVSDKVIIVGSGGLWVYDPRTRVLTKPKSWGSPQNATGYANTLVYRPANQKMYLMVANRPPTTTGAVWEVTLDRANFANSTMTLVTPVTGSPGLSNNSVYAYDTANDKICGGLLDGHIFCFDPGTRNWQDLTVQKEAGSTAALVTLLNRWSWTYSTLHNVFVFVAPSALSTPATNRTWVWRYAPAAPPVAPFPVGTLTNDGPATPEQLSLLLPVTGSLPQTATATVRYKPTASGTWSVGHPLLRIQPSYATAGGGGILSIIDAFAWPIIGLTPDTAYNVEVTVSDGGQSEIKTATLTTRALPAACGPANTIIPAGSTTAAIQTILDAANPGDVLQFADGTHTLTTELTFTRNGTAGNPICIRGTSRTGTIVKHTSGRVLYILAANYLTFENMTIEGSSVDSGTAASSDGIFFYNQPGNQAGVTVRNLTMNGVDKAVVAQSAVSELLVYDNTFNGNNTWTQDLYASGGSGAPGAGDGTLDLEQNLFWNDDGVITPGFGNVVFNNTLKGFGDALATCSHSGGFAAAECRGIYFYRNDILMTGDDGVEADFSFRNVAIYDNRWHNAATCLSVDPVFGGPLIFARNVCINVMRGPYKLNDSNSGHFIFNNTVLRTNGFGSGAGFGWYQANNGAQRTWGYENNILIYRGTGDVFVYEPVMPAPSPLDFAYNSWFLDGRFRWTASGAGGTFNTLALAQAGIPDTVPVFSGQVKRHFQDNISESDPFITDITLAADHRFEVTAYATPTLSPATAAKGTGVAIANITDGYSGGAPDRGAMITGQTPPVWGDRSTVVVPPSGVTIREGGGTQSGGGLIQ